MNILKLDTGVYRLTKRIVNPCYDKKKHHDWRYRKELPIDAIYVVRVTYGHTTTEEINGTMIDHHYRIINVENGSPGPGTAGTIKFKFIINTKHGKKPKLSNIDIPDGCDLVPLDFLKALKLDYSAEGLWGWFLCRNARGIMFNPNDLVSKLAESGKLSAADLRDALVSMIPKHYLWNEKYPWKL